MKDAFNEAVPIFDIQRFRFSTFTLIKDGVSYHPVEALRSNDNVFRLRFALDDVSASEWRMNTEELTGLHGISVQQVYATQAAVPPEYGGITGDGVAIGVAGTAATNHCRIQFDVDLNDPTLLAGSVEAFNADGPVPIVDFQDSTNGLLTMVFDGDFALPITIRVTNPVNENVFNNGATKILPTEYLFG